MNEFKRDGDTVRIPAGEYFISDPCYVIADDAWMGWLEAADYTRSDILVAQIPDSEFWGLGFGTAYGDGVYSDQNGRNFPVDAGLIGVVPVAYDPTYNGVRVTFNTAVDCRIIKDGDSYILKFGDIEIETGDSNEILCENCGDDISDEYSFCGLCESCEREAVERDEDDDDE